MGIVDAVSAVEWGEDEEKICDSGGGRGASPWRIMPLGEAEEGARGGRRLWRKPGSVFGRAGGFG